MMSNRRNLILVWSLFAILFFVNLAYTFHYAVEMPILDELAFVDLWHKSTSLSPDFLLFQHSDSRAVFTRIFGWINLHVAGYSFYFDLILNFALLAAIVGCFLWINQQFTILSAATVVLFAIFLISPITSQIHYSRICNQWRFFEIFAILSSMVLFRKRLSPVRDLFGGSFLALCSLYSFIGGLPASLALMTLKTITVILEWNNYSKRIRWCWFACLVLYGLGLAGFFVGYVFANSKIFWPWTWIFWDHYLNLIAMGFNGMEEVSSLIGALDFVLILAPVVILARRNWRDPRFQVLTAIILSILSSMVLISLGRSGDGPEFAKIYRYAETGILLIVPTVMLWWLVLVRYSWRSKAINLFFVYLFLFFLNDWDFHVYNHIGQRAQRAQDCLLKHYVENTDGRCPDLSPQSTIRYVLETGKHLKLAFFLQIQERAKKE